MRPLSVAVVCACVASAFAFSAAAPAGAGTPCWKSVIADWSKDDDVDSRYPTTCLRQAMVNAPTDLRIYSSLEDDLRAALRTRSARRLAGAPAAEAASLAASNGSSTLSPLVIVLAGLGLAAAASTGALLVRRRRVGR